MNLNCRALAMLRAVSAGRAEMTCSCEPDLYVDGLCVCDQFMAHMLSADGLICPSSLGAIGMRVRAELTPVGMAVLEGS